MKVALEPGCVYSAFLKNIAGIEDDDDFIEESDGILWILVLELKPFKFYPTVVYLNKDGKICENTLFHMDTFRWIRFE